MACCTDSQVHFIEESTLGGSAADIWEKSLGCTPDLLVFTVEKHFGILLNPARTGGNIFGRASEFASAWGNILW